ncbi:MAG: CYTH domain-containing protein [Brachymonas sp.]|nr:CYTH domain-containing protein [Brachymonas sp.]
MSKEIERKFLVKGRAWKDQAEGVLYRQGYLNSAKERVVRVRTIAEKAFITIKGITSGVSRLEFEYEIPFADAKHMLDELVEKPIIEKRRYKIEQDGLLWEIDEFLGDNEGLVVAEVELKDEHQALNLPSWIGEEVSSDPRYFNNNLVAHPYTRWSKR